MHDDLTGPGAARAKRSNPKTILIVTVLTAAALLLAANLLGLNGGGQKEDGFQRTLLYDASSGSPQAMPDWCSGLVLPDRPALFRAVGDAFSDCTWKVELLTGSDGGELLDVTLSFRPGDRDASAHILISPGAPPSSFPAFSTLLPLAGEPSGSVAAAGRTATVLLSSDGEARASFLQFEEEGLTFTLFSGHQGDFTRPENAGFAQLLLESAAGFLPGS